MSYLSIYLFDDWKNVWVLFVRRNPQGEAMIKWYWTLPDMSRSQSWWETFCGYINVGLIGAGIGLLLILLGVKP